LKNPPVFVVVVGYRNHEGVVSCAKAVLRSSYPNLFVIGIDNGSESVNPTDLGERFELHGTRSNAGYASGCDLGARIALSRGAEYILFLNDDVVPDSACIESMVQRMQSKEDLGLLCPVVLRGERDVIETAGGEYNEWIGLSLFVHSGASYRTVLGSATKTDFVTGAALMARANSLRTSGLLDQRYFMYLEDVDISFRTKSKGYSVEVLTATSVRHAQSSTSGRFRGLKEYYMMRNRIILCWLLGMRAQLVTVAISSPWILLLRVLKGLRRMRQGELRGLVYGLIDGLGLKHGVSTRSRYSPP
jgi:GT2 family glycosyltransferase